VGSLQLWPGASNVIPGHVNITVDLRASGAALDKLVLRLHEAVKRSCVGLSCNVVTIHEAPTVWCGQKTVELLSQAAHSVSGSYVSSVPVEGAMQPKALPVITSGAGHDAMVLAEIADVGLLFVRCRDGISHSPLEFVRPEDVTYATCTLYTYLALSVL
jgi:allantoate deiminase